MRTRPTVPSESGDRLPAWLGPAVVALVTLVHVAPFFVTFIEGDFARDLHAALGIARGTAFPREGPIISGTLHLGPAWYYALAATISLGGTMTAVVASIAAVSGLQYAIAWRLGAEAFDERTGIAWAIMLALPGVGSLASLWIAHPSLTATLTLAFLWALWRAHARNSTAALVLSGLALGLAFHAHPTALPLGVAFGAVAVERVRRDRWRGAAAALAACVLAVAPFVPLAADLPRHFQSLATLGGVVAADTASFRAAGWASVTTNALWRVPDLVVGTWLAGDGRPPVAWRAALVLLYGGALVGAALVLRYGPASRRRAFLTVGLAFAAWLAFVTAVRGETRFYMLYAPMPLAALLLALGLRGLASHAGRAGRGAAVLLAAGALAWSVAVGTARVVRAVGDDVRLPPLLGAHVDLQRSDVSAPERLRYLPVRALDTIGRRLCRDGVTHLYGDLAQVIDSQFNVAARMRCGEATRVVIGGTPGAGDRAMFLLPREMLEPRAALREFGGFGWGRVDTLLVAGPAIPLARGDDYPARSGCGTPAPRTFTFETTRAATLVIANGLPITCPMRVVLLQRDGAPVAPAVAGDSSWVRAPATPARWSLVVEIGEPGAVQVFTVAPPRDPNAPAN